MQELFGSIPTVLAELGVDAGSREALVLSAWTRSAGALLSERTAAIEFFENRLIVAVADDTWRLHLEDLSPQMLVKLNAVLGEGTVRFIEFRIDQQKLASRGRPEIRSETVHRVDPSLKSAAQVIKNDDLRGAFLKTAGSYLARQKRRKVEK